MHSKCNALESSQNHPPPQCVEKLPSTKLVPGAKKVGDCCLNCLWYRLVGGHPPRRVLDVRTGWSSVSKYPGESETNGVLLYSIPVAPGWGQALWGFQHGLHTAAVQLVGMVSEAVGHPSVGSHLCCVSIPGPCGPEFRRLFDTL